MDSNDRQNRALPKAESGEPIVVSNDRKRFIRHDGHRPSADFSPETYLQLASKTVIDEESLKLVQVLELHAAIDRTRSVAGSAVLLRSLVQPCTDLAHIRAKQEALREIASDGRLRRALRDGVAEFRKGEKALYRFFNKGLYALYPYADLKKARMAAVRICAILDAPCEPRSSYLKGLVSRLRSYRKSAVGRLMRGAIYKTFHGLKPGDAVSFFTPKRKFTPCRFSKWALAGPAVAAAPYLAGFMGFGQAVSPALTGIGLAWSGLYAFYAFFIKPVKDTGNFIEPLRVRCVADPALVRAVDAMGRVDALLSCHDLSGSPDIAVVLPEIRDERRHHFVATGLKNPVLAAGNPEFVPNDVRLNGNRLTFFTGPNSGGKTTICKSIVQNQLLAQAGAYVQAEKATVGIADTIRYQAPRFDGLQDEEGRFGTELARTRDIFYATTPRSLVVLDELAEGTTTEERMRASVGILDDFYNIGNNTILVTHNHLLVDRFMGAEKGKCLMAAFTADAPTYRIVPGISRVSHADRIAAKLGFSGEDRRRYLKEKGYI